MSAVLVALSLMVLLGMAAVALDLGNVYQERRSARNAADQAALTAAYIECTGGSEMDAVAAGMSAAARNGFDDIDPDVTVTVSRHSDSQYLAAITMDVDTTFGRVLGVSELGTTGNAVVSCTEGSGKAVSLFAKATGCPGDDELRIPTDDVEITGGIHSNGKINIRGNSPSIDGGVTYGVPYIPEGPGPVNGIHDRGDPPHEYNPQPAQGSPAEDWPVEYVLADYLPGNHFDSTYTPSGLYHDEGSGLREFKNETVEGVYYVDGDFFFKENVLVGPRGVTFVATGQIRWFEAHDVFRPFDDPQNKSLLAYSTRGSQTCSEPSFHSSSVMISEDGGGFDGVLYAPNGVASVTGNSSRTVAVWGWFVETHGDDFATDGPDIDTAGDPELVFEE